MVMETIRGSRFIPVYVSLLTAAIFLCSVKECQGSYFGTTQKRLVLFITPVVTELACITVASNDWHMYDVVVF